MMTHTDNRTQFYDWMEREYCNLKHILISRGIYDPDTFHDTFLRLSEGSERFIGKSDYRKCFDATYAELSKNNRWLEFRETTVSPMFFDMQSEIDEETERPTEPVAYPESILSVSKRILSAPQYQTVLLRYEHGMTFKVIAEYIGKRAETIGQTLNESLSILRNHLTQQNYEPCII